MENDRWLADLEIEVTNTGTKPIYYLAIAVFFKDVKKDSGNQIGYQMHYGRGKMVDIGERATPEDVPIPPGGTHVFKLHEDYVKGWNWYRTRVERKPHPKKIGIRFDVLNHGDGTGYLGTDGFPLPNRSSNRHGSADRWARISNQTASPPNLASYYDALSYLPAAFSPVNFFPAGLITSGRELFGHLTAQPASASPNGFLALAEFDRPEGGSNSDGAIDARDAVFASLRLWRDENQNGVSEPGELHMLLSLDVVRIHLDYRESKRVDAYGNLFKYRAKVDDARGAG